MNNFKFEALNHLDFEYLNDLSETELAENHIKKMKVDQFPGFLAGLLWKMLKSMKWFFSSTMIFTMSILPIGQTDLFL